MRYKRKLKSFKRAVRDLARRSLGVLATDRTPPQPAPQPLIERGGRDFRPDLPTIILVSHEATRTGAPIIALQLAADMSEWANVICWSGKPGPLSAALRRCAVAYVPQFFTAAQRRTILSDLRRQFDVRFAILNSVVSYTVMEEFGEAGIPMVLLMHEFTEYLRPRGWATSAVLKADAVILPAEIVHRSLLDEIEELRIPGPPKNTYIRHQGICEVRNSPECTGKAPGISRTEILTRIGVAPGEPKPIIVLGVGWVQPRKGLDLFMETARIVSRASDRPVRFVWVGANFQPDDMRFGVYLADQRSRSDLAEVVYFFEEQPHIQAFLEIADVFFLSSRLDPFPNVALEAIVSGVPVVCFDRSTGVVELAAPDRLVAVPYTDCTAAAQEILRLASDAAGVRNRLRAQLDALNQRLDSRSYARFVFELGERVAPERERQMQQARQRASQMDLRQYVSGLPNWAVDCATGPADANAIVRRIADAEISGLMLAQSTGADGHSPAGAIEVRRVDPDAPATSAPGGDGKLKFAIHLYVDRVRSLQSLDRLLERWSGQHIAITCGNVNLAEPLSRLTRNLGDRCSLIAEPSCADPSLALLTAIAALKDEFDVVGNLLLLDGTEESVSFGRPVARWHRSFMAKRSMLAAAHEAFAAEDQLALLFMNTPRLVGNRASGEVARRLASSVGVTPRVDGARFPLDLTCWLRPAALPQLSDHRLADAARSLISKVTLQHRIDGFSRFLAALCAAGSARAAAFAVPSIIEASAPQVAPER